MTELETPGAIDVVLSCPRCGAITSVQAQLHTRLVADDDGTGTLGVRARAPKVPHVCGQTSLTLTFDPIEDREDPES